GPGLPSGCGCNVVHLCSLVESRSSGGGSPQRHQNMTSLSFGSAGNSDGFALKPTALDCPATRMRSRVSAAKVALAMSDRRAGRSLFITEKGGVLERIRMVRLE